jgi:hypothetical protein
MENILTQILLIEVAFCIVLVSDGVYKMAFVNTFMKYLVLLKQGISWKSKYL